MPLLPRLSLPALGLLLCASLAAPLPALAKKHNASASSASAAGHGQKAPRKASRAAPRSSSEESRAERDRRLQRECRGLPNAGACLGYAS